jgi:hypothetical protein
MGQDTSALETLVSIIEPVKEYRRYQHRPQTMLSPLTGLIDAAQPDAKGARAFNRAVDLLVAGVDTAENAAKIRAMVTKWRSAETELQATMEKSPALAEARQLSDDLKNLNQIILEALDAREKGSTPTPEWHAAKTRALDEIAKPKAALEFVIVSGVRKLVDRAAGARSN